MFNHKFFFGKFEGKSNRSPFHFLSMQLNASVSRVVFQVFDLLML